MKKILFTLTMVIFGFGLFAAPVSQETAKQVAVNFYKHYVPTITDYSITDVVLGERDGMTTYYVFNFKAGGFVMVSADDAAIPVLGYSPTDTFDKNNLPPNAQNYFNDYSRQIKFIVDTKVSNAPTVKEWKKIENNEFADDKGIDVVTPLLGTIAWDQTGSWAAKCPSQYPAGCVATATGQVMKFWSYPATGVGSHSYLEPNSATVLSYNYAQAINWSAMSNTAAGTDNENLLYHIGIAVDMSYAAAGSGASEADIPRALIENYNYQPTAEILSYSQFTNADWIAMLENELNYGRPVLYAGADGGGSGHSFVFDGWNSSNQFHVNWGWSGTSNNYFAIGALNSGSGNFNLSNQAVIRVRPKSNAPMANFTADAAFIPVGGSVNFTDLSTNSPTSWSWSFAGGTPATSSSQTPGAITYTTAGKYMVTLTVTNGTGSDTKTVSKMISVGSATPYWVKQDLGYPKTNVYYNRMVSGIYACSSNVAWATIIDAGAATHYVNECAVTSNGGTTWKIDTIKFTNSANYSIANICALDASTAFAAMFPIMSANGGVIVKTTNGGTTWTPLSATPDFSTSWLDFVYFFDANNGVCVGDATTTSPYAFIVYTTSNGGTSWTKITGTTNIPAAASGETAYTNEYSAVKDTIWFGTSMGNVYRSVNKGTTWTKVATGFGTGYQVLTSFRSGTVGYVIASANTSPYAFKGVRKTTNGGTTYTAVTPTGYYVKTPNFVPIPGTASDWVDVTGGYSSGSSLSSNDCASFANIDTGTVYYTCAKFFDLNSGWAGSIVDPTNNGIWKWNPSLITGVDNSINTKPEQVNVYPNPASSQVNILFSGISAKSTVNIYNLVGEKIYSNEVNPSFDNLLKLDMSAYKSGIYIVTVDTGKNIISKRFMLVK